MAKVLLRQFCNSNWIHLYEQITFSSSGNVNTVEWLVSMPAVQVFVDSALTICFGSEWSDGTFDGNAFCVAYVFKCWGLRQWFSTWGLFAYFLWVARVPGKFVHKLLLYFVFRTWNHFLPYPKQWNYLAVAQSIILFWRGKSMTSSVIDVLRPTVSVTPVQVRTQGDAGDASPHQT